MPVRRSRRLCFADFRLTSWNVRWSLAITERLSPMSNQRKRVNDSGEEKVAILRAMAGSNAVTGDQEPVRPSFDTSKSLATTA
jgi:hypothetical protein